MPRTIALVRSYLPASIALVLAGLLVGALVPAARTIVSADVVLYVLIPGLVFAAAFDLEWRVLRRVLPAVIALAVPGVVASAVVVAVALVLAGVPWSLAFIVGAITAATDPVAVVSTLSKLRMPTRLRTLVEAESLLNDGTGLVLYAIAIAAAAGLGLADSAVMFAITIGASVAAGAIIGFGAALLVRTSREPALAFVVSTVVAYGTFAAAAISGVSGLLATVVAAIVLGNALRVSSRDVRAARAISRAWSYVALALSASVFLAIGVAVDVAALPRELPAIAAGVAGITLARAVMVYVPFLLAAPRELLGWAHVVFWSGLRGAVALAAALSLPPSLPAAETLRSISFGIVIVTLVAQGSLTPLVVRAADPLPFGDQD